MSTKTIAMLGLRVVVLAFLLLVCYSIASMSVGLMDSAQTADRMGAMVALLIMCALDTIVLSYPIIRSRFRGIFFLHLSLLIFLGAAIQRRIKAKQVIRIAIFRAIE